MTSSSPLYTAPQAQILKRQIISDLGKDKDGAFRAYNRLDGKGSKIKVELTPRLTMAEEVLAAEAS